MATKQKMLRSFRNYLDTLEALTYDDLQNSVRSDIVWQEGQMRRNPSAYELFTSHEHFDFPKDDIFKFSGIVLDSDTFESAADKVQEIWQRRLPLLFPGFEFVIQRDRDHRQVAFCRKRPGITEKVDELIFYLNHNHPYIRWNALLSATLYPHPRLVPYLLERLNDSDVYNRLKAIIALGESKNEKLIPLLKKRFLKLQEGPGGKYFIDDFFAYDLFRTLLKLGDTGYKTVFGLFRKYKSLDEHTLEHLCELLGKTGKPEVMDILLDIFYNDPEAGDFALTGLLGMEHAVLPVITANLGSADPEVRRNSMWFVANCYITEARCYLAEGLQDKSSRVREAAIHGIGRFYHRTRRGLLLNALNDRAANVRIKALVALGHLFDPRLLPRFQELCADKNAQVRHEAMRAIAALDSKVGIDFLTLLYEKSTKADRLRIMQSLYAYTGRPSYLKTIISKALASGDRLIIREAKDLLEIL